MFPNQFAHFLGVFVVAAWKRFTANSIRFTRTITSAENSIDGLDCVLMTECHKNWTAVQQQHHYISFAHLFSTRFFCVEHRLEGDALNFNFQWISPNRNKSVDNNRQ